LRALRQAQDKLREAIVAGKEIASSPPAPRNDTTLHLLMKSGSYEIPHPHLIPYRPGDKMPFGSKARLISLHTSGKVSSRVIASAWKSSGAREIG
jgi:hypothetical protein